MDNQEIITKDLKPNELLNFLGNYYSIKERRDHSFDYDAKITDDGVNLGVDLKIYTEVFIIGKKIKIILADKDIFEVLNVWAYNNDLKLLNFKYLGHVRNIGYYFNEPTPVFEGVRLFMKKRDKTRKKLKDWLYGRIIIN